MEDPRRAIEMDTTPKLALYLLGLIVSIGFVGMMAVLLVIVFILGYQF